MADWQTFYDIFVPDLQFFLDVFGFMSRYFTGRSLWPPKKFSPESPHLGVMYRLYEMPHIFAIHLDLIVKKTVPWELHSPCTKTGPLFLSVKKLLRPQTNFKLPEVYFIESAGISRYIFTLRSDFITILKCCVINTLYFRFFQNKRNHRNYAERKQGYQKLSLS